MINRTFLAIILTISFSCGKSQDSASVESIVYSVDSVVVDSMGEILYLEYLLQVSDYCQEDEFLYNYSEFDHSIEKIDLDRLELVDKYPLQKEGPDGTGSWISSLKSMGNGKLFLAGQYGGHFNLEGRLVKKFDWNNISLAQGGMDDKENVYQQMANPSFDHLAFGLVTDHSTNRISLKKLNIADTLISTFEIDPNGNYKKYTLGDLTTYNKWDPRVFITSQQDELIVSHEFSNDFYVYSPEYDELQQVTYSSQHTPSKITIATEGDVINSIEDRINALESYHEQVSFGPLVLDPQNERYYRLSSSRTFGEEKRERRLLHETTNIDVFLSVFDMEFNLLSETPIPELNTNPSAKYFVKDGMLWVFQNRDDEMGFVRVVISE
ncbi:DUF4221 family protein [Cyclobacterium jeungdonense]|uniref:DUF4221 family protein n=1 Tax=Cyclobacterium jeungdonense TaxID=708087 RepID=A0ABT8CAD7_9BACT|nr:DUF4221 family protein [Cyclobacterium jeungdonense]MDN3688773.1 DUF4221 family protein [Cyclobacterium jeungdonense]